MDGGVEVKPCCQELPCVTDSQRYVLRVDSPIYALPPAEENESDRIEWAPSPSFEA